MRNTLILFTGTALLGWAGLTQAAPVCVGSTSAALTANAGCQLGSTNNDFQNPIQANVDAMFGFTDWALDAKDDDLNGVNAGPNSLGLSLTGGTISGSWSINASSFSLFSDIMMVFKGGNASPNTYVGFLLSGVSGGYLSPFVNPANGKLKNISHVSLYVRGAGTPPPPPPPPPTPVSEPGILMLLGLGALVSGIAGRRKA